MFLVGLFCKVGAERQPNASTNLGTKYLLRRPDTTDLVQPPLNMKSTEMRTDIGRAPFGRQQTPSTHLKSSLRSNSSPKVRGVAWRHIAQPSTQGSQTKSANYGRPAPSKFLCVLTMLFHATFTT